ncbi:tyrosine--tRNA ligase [Flavobacteriaceae bacterium]|jgi:tyrosyl-tRNA synthetase|nr:tyrosine--tRNA ligase [Flavobacteriaceae bacterium]MDB4560292.1 tyrosine--tRNA ligase [Flavobacteriaceae bacterium]MDB9948175.1 tyrosine--tRNA ligase [Flavobacteriaceae bacterium]MDC1168608.1 tyrosine--tRNA ligase [Flavobacteriaceae bacterium]MDC3285297.1 tyrosine--tRNA ligase [Flavobacteriaceae bacterium]
MTNFVEELRWRGLLHDIMPDTEAHLLEHATAGYIGFDPTADSLHIGSLVQILILKHFQNAGHKPIALVGGATGMVGDPSGKSAERNLLDEASLQKNIEGVKAQLSRFLDFNASENPAELVNNFDWMKDISLIDFVRDTGKHITVNYMMAKDSVKKRLSSESKVGMSFTEFTYQLFQGYDFYHLYKEMDCKLQMGGSDQWGNITTGTELIRRKAQGKAYAITVPLVTKADGTKFGKTEGGNVWLDANRTSPYKFYQYWLNASDEDAEKYIKIFTFLDKEAIEALIIEHRETPHLRLLQKKIGEEVTIMTHGQEAFDNAIKASQILFGKSTSEDLKSLDEQTFLDIFEGVPQASVSKEDIENGLDMIGALAAKTGFLNSNGEARRALKENAISVNKEKVKEDFVISTSDIIANAYVLLQRGKKNYFLLKIA